MSVALLLTNNKLNSLAISLVVVATKVAQVLVLLYLMHLLVGLLVSFLSAC